LIKRRLLVIGGLLLLSAKERAFKFFKKSAQKIFFDQIRPLLLPCF
jgi:hypothetical protein